MHTRLRAPPLYSSASVGSLQVPAATRLNNFGKKRAMQSIKTPEAALLTSAGLPWTRASSHGQATRPRPRAERHGYLNLWTIWPRELFDPSKAWGGGVLGWKWILWRNTLAKNTVQVGAPMETPHESFCFARQYLLPDGIWVTLLWALQIQDILRRPIW